MVTKSEQNDFHTDLEYSSEKIFDEQLNKYYYTLFPELKNIETIEDKGLQKRGVDKILHFHSGKKVFIDEKKRRKNHRDIFLEEYSVFEKKKEGWLSSGHYTDYIVYIIVPTKKVYLLPYLLLQKAWVTNFKNWREKYGIIKVPNKGYITTGIGVGVEEVYRAIKVEIDNDLLINIQEPDPFWDNF